MGKRKLPEGWKMEQIRNVTEINYGKAVDPNLIGGDVPAYGANGVLKKVQTELEDGKGIIIWRKWSVGAVTRVSWKFWPTDVTYYVIEKDSYNIDYFYYALLFLDLPRFAQWVKPWINREQIYQLSIPLPPLSEQKRIADELDRQFGAIEEMERRTLSMLSDSAWLNELIDSIYDSAFTSGELRHISEVAIVNPRRDDFDKSLISKITDEDETTFLPLPSVSENWYIQSRTTAPYSKLKKGYTYFRQGDVIMAKITPSMENKKSCIVDRTIHGFWFWSTEFHVLRPTEKIQDKYLLHFIRHKKFLNDCVMHFEGAVGHKRVPSEYIADYEIPIPDIQTQARISTELDARIALIHSIQSELEKQKENFTHLRTSILHDVFGGFES